MNNSNHFHNREFKGLDLKIDQTVQKLCEVSNASSSSSRTVLYVTLLTCIISIISVVNTMPEGFLLFNWKTERLKIEGDSLTAYVKENNLLKKSKGDTTLQGLKIEIQKTKIQSLNDVLTKNVNTVQIPIVGNSFDVNDLSVIAGLSLIILVGILLVTTKREKRNLRIALHAITERYPKPNEYPNEYSMTIDIQPAALGKKENMDDLGYQTIDDFVHQFNLTRRRYHYNFLSMNEIFTQPKTTLAKPTKKSEFRNSLTGKVVMNHMFYFPFGVYCLILINDLFSVDKGFRLSILHTVVQYSFSLMSLNLIAFLCYLCTIEKKTIQNEYDLFFKHDFVFSYEPTPGAKRSRYKLYNYTFYYTFKAFRDGAKAFWGRVVLTFKKLKHPSRSIGRHFK